MKRPPPVKAMVIEDLIIDCKVCGAPKGTACKPTARDKKWTPGWSHFGRRMKRLLLTAKGTSEERRRFEQAEIGRLGLLS